MRNRLTWHSILHVRHCKCEWSVSFAFTLKLDDSPAQNEFQLGHSLKCSLIESHTIVVRPIWNFFFGAQFLRCRGSQMIYYYLLPFMCLPSRDSTTCWDASHWMGWTDCDRFADLCDTKRFTHRFPFTHSSEFLYIHLLLNILRVLRWTMRLICFKQSLRFYGAVTEKIERNHSMEKKPFFSHFWKLA